MKLSLLVIFSSKHPTSFFFFTSHYLTPAKWRETDLHAGPPLFGSVFITWGTGRTRWSIPFSYENKKGFQEGGC